MEVLLEVVRALSGEKPCELYKYHKPYPAITEGHHWNPVFLQNRLWGKIHNNNLIWLCPTCHSNVHAWLDWLLGERKSKPSVPMRARAEAERTLRWYISEGGQVNGR